MKAKSKRSLLLKVLDFLQSQVFLFLASIPLHEWWHCFAAWMVGARLRIEFLFPSFGGYGVWKALPPESIVKFGMPFIYLAGGLGVFIFYVTAYFFSEDLEDRAAYLMFGFMNLFYAFTEMTLAWKAWQWVFYSYYGLAQVGGLVVGFLIWAWRDTDGLVKRDD